MNNENTEKKYSGTIRGVDNVNHPSHYEGYTGKVECIEFTRLMPFSLGNAFKYIWRAGKKGGPAKEIEDLQKALWYLKDHMEHCGKTVLGRLIEKLCYFLKIGDSDDVEKEKLKTLFSVIQDSIDDGGSNKAEAWRRFALWHITEGQCWLAQEAIKKRIEELLSRKVEVPVRWSWTTAINIICKKDADAKPHGFRLCKVVIPLNTGLTTERASHLICGIPFEFADIEDFKFMFERIKE